MFHYLFGNILAGADETTRSNNFDFAGINFGGSGHGPESKKFYLSEPVGWEGPGGSLF